MSTLSDAQRWQGCQGVRKRRPALIPLSYADIAEKRSVAADLIELLVSGRIPFGFGNCSIILYLGDRPCGKQKECEVRYMYGSLSRKRRVERWESSGYRMTSF